MKLISLLLILSWFSLGTAVATASAPNAAASVHNVADEERSVSERIQFLEEQHGYRFNKRPFKVALEGQVLYWKADVDGVAYATTSVQRHAQGTDGNIGTHIKTRTPHFPYDPGFRIELGVQSPFDLFDICLVWTRFYTQGRDKAHGTRVTSAVVPGDKLIFDEIGLVKPMVSIPNTASANCAIKENLLDLQFARGIPVSRHFFMRPYFGVRGVLSDIDWDIKFKRNFLIPGVFNQDSTRLKVKNDFHAIGGLIGLELDWKAPMGFGVSMRGAGALLWGPTQERTKQEYEFIPAGTATKSHQNYKAGNSFHTLKGLWELFVGVFWETDFRSKKHHRKSLFHVHKKEMQHLSLRFFAGYECQQWPWVGQKTTIQETRNRDRYSLGFQGFTGGARFVF